MSKSLKLLQLGSGTAISLLLLMQIWQSTFAQPPLKGGQAPQQESESEPKLIVVPTTGYQPQPKTAESEEGRKLFEQFNCAACHSIHNIGGDLAPRLDGIGGRRSQQFLIAHLSDAAEAKEAYKLIRGREFANSFPHSRYQPTNASLLISYLETLPEPPGGYVVSPHVPRLPAERSPVKISDFKPLATSADTEEGAKLFDRFGCIACHAVGDFGGWLGPRLDGIGARRERSYISAHITDAQAHAAEQQKSGEQIKSGMPRFQVGKKEIEQITDYLLSLPDLR